MLPEKAIAALFVGISSGLGLLVAQIAFASLIFSGPLAGYSTQGIGLILFGNFAACLIIAVSSGYRGAIAGLSPALVIVMAAVGFSMDAEGHSLFVTTVVALIMAAVAVAVCCLAIGHFRLSNLVRFIPYPVAAGFVAGIGGAVCIAALSMMGADFDWRAIRAQFDSSMFWNWGPGTVYGIALYAALRRWNNPYILPVSGVAAIVAFHYALSLLDISGSEARAAGLLLSSATQDGLWPSILPVDLAHIDWTAIGTQMPAIGMVVLVSLICVIMNIAGLEIAANQELDWNREFKATGLASVVAGVGGAMPASLIVPASMRSKLLGAQTQITGIVAAGVIGAALFFGDGMLELIPVSLVGGILVFAGVGMLDQGLVRTRARMPWSDYGIIVLIFFIIVVFGLFEGVGIGMAATLVFFAVRLSRADAVKSKFTMRDRRSSRIRPVTDRAILSDRGERVLACELHGYIFFGSVSVLIDRLRRLVDGALRPDCLILDFSNVSGFDFSAVDALCRFMQKAGKANVLLALSALPEQLRRGLQRNLPPAEFDLLVIEPDLEFALERCEDITIALWRKEADTADEYRHSLLDLVSDDLERHLERQSRFESLMDMLQSLFDSRRCETGEALAKSASAHETLQLIISGRASAYNAAGVRLDQFGPGDALWPAAMDGDKPDSVITDEPCRIIELTSYDLNWLDRNRERLALELYRYLLSCNRR